MEIDKIPISEITPYSKNPRKNERAVEVVSKSIREFGFKVPIILDKDNVIIAGHTRLKAAQKLGLTEVPVIWADDLTEEQVKAFRIMDNKSMEYADWNIDLLKEEFKDLKDMEYDLSLIGFSESELNKLMSDDDEEELPDPEKPKYDIKLGEIWQLGNHRVMCGSSTDSSNVEALCGSERANMVFTDPPYNVDYKGMQNSKQWDAIANDMMSPGQFKDFLANAFCLMYKHTIDEAGVYIRHADKSHVEFRQAFEEAGFGWRATIIWVKNSPAFNFAQYKYKHEPIFYCYKEGKTVNWYGDRTQNIIWQAKKEKGEHPTIKPTELIIPAIINSSKEGDIVLDLFGGSGSTLIAAEKAKRKCLMMELDPKYVSVIIERWENLTKQKGVKWK